MGADQSNDGRCAGGVGGGVLCSSHTETTGSEEKTNRNLDVNTLFLSIDSA